MTPGRRVARKILLQPLVMLLVLGPTFAPRLFANGGKAKQTGYTADVTLPLGQPGRPKCHFIVDTNPVMFFLETVNNKYHVLLIRVKNDTNVPLVLDKDRDTVSIQVSGFTRLVEIKGLLDIPKADPATWDGLDASLRTAIAYPPVVEPHEEEGIYVFIPDGDIKVWREMQEMPGRITYSIKSLKGDVYLYRPVETRD